MRPRRNSGGPARGYRRPLARSRLTSSVRPFDYNELPPQKLGGTIITTRDGDSWAERAGVRVRTVTAVRPPAAAEDVRPAVAWSPRDVIVAILVLFAGLGLLLLLLAVTIRGVGRPPPGFGLTLSTILSTLATEGALLALVSVFALRRGSDWSQLGLRVFSPAGLLPAGSVLVLAFLVNLFYAVLIRTLDIDALQPAGARELLPLFGGGGVGLAVGLLLAGGVAPFMEEIFFRGFVFGGLVRPLGFAGAAAVSSFVFAIVHLQVATVLPIFVLGCLLAWLYQRTNSLWPPILVHATYNSIALVAAFTYAGSI